MRVRYATAAGIAVIVVAVGAFLFIPAKRVIGTNNVHPFLPVIELAPGEKACDTVAEVPGGTGGVRLRAESEGGAVDGLRVKVTGSPKQRSVASVSGGANGVLSVPVRPAARGAAPARLCAADAGPRPITIFGEFKRPDGEKIRGLATLRNVRVPSFVFVEAEGSTRFSHKGKVLELFGFGHAGWIGKWALWLAGLLATTAAALAMWRVTRDAEVGDQ